MVHLFILNPTAGKGRSLEYLPYIEQVFNEIDDDYVVEITKYAGHATEIAKKYSNVENCKIYSVGGDGTLNEIVNGITPGRAVLGVIPAGSGNDFIRSIGVSIPNNAPAMINLVKKTICGTEREVDLARVNDRYFINIASVGFDADVVYNTVALKKLSMFTSSLAYTSGIFITLFKYRNYELDINIDGDHLKDEYLLVAVANGKYYGGGMQPAPEALLDDGLLDVCLVKGMNRAKILRLFPLYMKGRHEKVKGVSFYRCKRIEISCTRDIGLNIDGEVELTRSVVFEILPKGIKILESEI